MSLSNKLAIIDVDLKGKRVLIRVRPASTYHPKAKKYLRILIHAP